MFRLEPTLTGLYRVRAELAARDGIGVRKIGMRIIAGTFRSRQLKSLKGLSLRPTSDMLRETLFNILGTRVEGSRFLDLFAGTGAIGIEAVSRGAAFVACVEKHSKTVHLIRENLASLEIVEGVRVIPADALTAVATLEKESVLPFDLIFLDPPYANESEYKETLRVINQSKLVHDSTLIIAEHYKSFELPASLTRFERARILRHGDAALTFYRRSS
jgi:16S rRNA (guanine966-N2)-methyltransferase